ncbi:hypothetical protein U0070_016129 [Myodes glareolus]|uniref:VPS13-like middle region domain-containing protein n=1 Tax=Myodes glareolus TaxID=447135 RepID=A0AAW0IDP8_MYOGA
MDLVKSHLMFAMREEIEYRSVGQGLAAVIRVFWGQEHLNCLSLLHELFSGYLQEEGSFEVPVPESAPQLPSPVDKTQALKSEPSSDDLRTGAFQYLQDAEPLKLPGAYEVLFCSETDESPGMMLWRYPEPRVLTLVRITPVPFNTTEDPDISTADLGDVLQGTGGTSKVSSVVVDSGGRQSYAEDISALVPSSLPLVQLKNRDN